MDLMENQSLFEALIDEKSFTLILKNFLVISSGQVVLADWTTKPAILGSIPGPVKLRLQPLIQHWVNTCT